MSFSLILGQLIPCGSSRCRVVSLPSVVLMLLEQE